MEKTTTEAGTGSTSNFVMIGILDHLPESSCWGSDKDGRPVCSARPRAQRCAARPLDGCNRAVALEEPSAERGSTNSFDNAMIDGKGGIAE